MIYMSFVELLSLIPHAKFQNQRPSDSGEEGFSSYSHGGHHVSWDLDYLYKFSFPLHKNAPHEVWL